MGFRSLLYVILHNFGHSGQDDKSLSNLFGFNRGNELEVFNVKSESQDWVNPSIQHSELVFILNHKSLANLFSGLLSNREVSQFEREFSQVSS
jgi:hypothetical protein